MIVAILTGAVIGVVLGVLAVKNPQVPAILWYALVTAFGSIKTISDLRWTLQPCITPTGWSASCTKDGINLILTVVAGFIAYNVVVNLADYFKQRQMKGPR
jgi:hypothetical protein